MPAVTTGRRRNRRTLRARLSIVVVALLGFLAGDSPLFFVHHYAHQDSLSASCAKFSSLADWLLRVDEMPDANDA